MRINEIFKMDKNIYDEFYSKYPKLDQLQAKKHIDLGEILGYTINCISSNKIIFIHDLTTGEPVGYLEYNGKIENKKIQIINASFHSKYQGRNQMHLIYKHLISLGIKLLPPDKIRQTKGGKNIWKNLK